MHVRDPQDEPFLDIGAKEVPDYSVVVRAICAQAGFTPRVVLQVESADLMVACVAAGIGVSLMWMDKDMPIHGVAYRPLRPATPEMKFFAVSRAGNDNPALPAFLECVRRAAAA